MEILTNCSLCKEKELRVMGDKNVRTSQCLSCGFASSDKFKFEGSKEDNDAYNALNDDMKGWAKEDNNRIWIPSLITLPNAVVFPIDVDDEMRWGYGEMVVITEDEKENYPNPEGGFYDKKYDTDKAKIFKNFKEALELAKKSLKPPEVKEKKIKLPKLKKI